jgi:hypothetical protein
MTKVEIAETLRLCGELVNALVGEICKKG